MKIWPKPWCACLNFIAAGAQLSQTEPLTRQHNWSEYIRALSLELKIAASSICILMCLPEGGPQNSYYRPISCTQLQHTNTDTFVCKQTHAALQKPVRHLHCKACSRRLVNTHINVHTLKHTRRNRHLRVQNSHKCKSQKLSSMKQYIAAQWHAQTCKSLRKNIQTHWCSEY